MSAQTLVIDCVHAFITDVGSALDAVFISRGQQPGDHRLEVAADAFNIACACVDADGRRTDTELRALARAFAGLLPELGLNPDDPAGLRNSDIINSRANSMESTGALFNLLVDADRADGTVLGSIYYQRALDLAHAMAALDEVTAPSELAAIGTFRTKMLASMGRATTPGPILTNAPSASTPVGVIDPPPALDAPPEREPLEPLLAKLNALVGLDDVKREVRQLADLLRVGQLRRTHNLPVVDTGLHMIFVGNPGTGKTTVARLVARILHSLEVLDTGRLVETDRAGMVAGFVGQTAPMVRARFDEAAGGVLFVDEAYTLARGGGNDFGREAIDTMVKLMEDRRGSVVVIIAGYVDEMKSLVASNPGLRSRFTRTLNFPDYSTGQLTTIFTNICVEHRYELDSDALEALAAAFDAEPREVGFGNGRYARNLFEAAIACQASRLIAAERSGPTDETGDNSSETSTGPDAEELVRLSAEDLLSAAAILSAANA